MRISSKGCYAVAALTEMALDETNDCIAVATLAQRLSISKIYLEQVFSILKRSGLIIATKGAQGGYTLRSKPEDINLKDILAPIELHLFEPGEKSIENIPPELGLTMDALIFKPLENVVIQILTSVTLSDLAAGVRQQRNKGHMYFI